MDDHVRSTTQVVVYGKTLTDTVDSLRKRVDQFGSSRELSLAKQKLDEAKMWINQHVEHVLDKDR